MKQESKWITHVAVGLAAVMMAGAAWADEVYLGSIAMRDVRITNISDGKLQFRSATGARTVELSSVTKIHLANFPDYQDAVAKIGKDDAAAEQSLKDVLSEVKPSFLKPLVRVQLSRALDNQGKFNEAFKQYARAIEKDPSVYYLGLAPKKLPTDKADRAKALALVNQSMQDIEGGVAKAVLGNLAKQLTDTGDANNNGNGNNANNTNGNNGTEADPNKDPDPTPAVPTNVRVPKRSDVEAHIRRGDFDKAIDTLNQLINDPDMRGRDRLLPGLYYQRGQAEVKAKRPVQAAGSFLRVAIHFPDHELAVPAMEAAAGQLASAGHAAAARQTYQAAIKKTKDQSTRQRLTEALDKLPAP